MLTNSLSAMDAPMKNNHTYGKAAAILGLIALFCAIILIYTYNDPTNPTGPITQFIGNLLYTPASQSVESTMQRVGTFDISQKNIRLLLAALIILISAVSGILAILTSKKEHASLWYTLGIAFSTTSLITLSNLAGIIFMFVCGFLCLQNRKWKMTHQ